MKFWRRLVLVCILLVAVAQVFAQQDTLLLYGSTTSGVKGEIAMIDLRVNNFTDIIAFQASLNWDPAQLSYVEVTDFGISDFSATNFGTNSVSQGHLRFLWEPSNAQPISAVDSTILFKAHFEILAESAQLALIGYVDEVSTFPFKVEFADKDGTILPTQTTEARVNIQDPAVPEVTIISQPTTFCGSEMGNGRLHANVESDTINFAFHWFKGDVPGSTADYIGATYSNLTAGTYTLQVYDSLDQLFADSINAVVSDGSVGLEVSITSAKNNLCVGGNGSASALAQGVDSLDQRVFWFHEGDVLDTAQARHVGVTYDSLIAGTYRAIVFQTSSGCSGDASVAVLDSLIYPEASIEQRNDTLYANDPMADWYLDDVLYSENQLYIVPTESGDYTIVVANEYSCEQESDPVYFGITGLEDLSERLSIYPNPFSETLRIDNRDLSIDRVEVFDHNGKILSEKVDVKHQFIELQLTGSTNGVYLIRIEQEGKIHTRKVLQKRSK